MRRITLDSKGQLWAGTDRGVRLAAGDTLRAFFKDEWIGGIAEALGGRMFCGGWDLPLHIWEDGDWRALSPEELNVSSGDPRERGPDARVISMAGTDKVLWVGTWGYGLYAYDGAKWQRYTRRDGLGCDHVERLAARGGQLLIEHDGAGVTHYDGRRWRFYDDIEGLPSRAVRALAFTPDGVPWIVQDDGRVARLVKGRWLGGNTTHDLASLVADTDGGMWIGAEQGGLVRLVLERKP